MTGQPETYDVRIWATDVYRGSRVTSYRVCWWTAGKRHKETFRTAAAADGFRSELMTAHRRGELFDVATGRPVSTLRREPEPKSWYAFACEYVEEKWPTTSPHHRKGTAEVLATVTAAVLGDAFPADPIDARAMRSALTNWGFTQHRDLSTRPAGTGGILAQVERNSPDMSIFGDAREVRAVLRYLGTKLDGTRAADRTFAWRRSVLSTALAYAVETGVLKANPLDAVRTPPQRAILSIDRRSVISPAQACRLLDAVAATARSGPQLVAFFGAMYYAALRPEEATNLRRSNLELPARGWGWITLEGATPEVDAHWSDSGVRREPRELKHRAVGETRRVPCTPQLTALFHAHLAEFGVDGEGRLFRGLRGGPVAGVTYRRLWQRAREKALTSEQTASPLAARPYDLRHAAVSTWLNGGVAPTQVADWAGHSVAVLLKVYAKCIDGETDAALRKIEVSLGAVDISEGAVRRSQPVAHIPRKDLVRRS